MISQERFGSLSAAYPRLRVAIVGDFCLDRYLEIDPARAETSIETGLPVHNVIRVRAQPGAAGTILNNLVALGIGSIFPIGFCGDDGEGYELVRSLSRLQGVRMDHFVRTPLRRTFTYCKPLVLSPGQPPRELNRLDSKNWDPTPQELEDQLARHVLAAAQKVDAMIVLDQVDAPGTGVITSGVLKAIAEVGRQHPGMPVLADSRRGLRGFPPVTYKMNAAELAAFSGGGAVAGVDQVLALAREVAKKNQRAVFVTLSDQGIAGAAPNGDCCHVKTLPVKGEIDIVGAGDCVSANLTAALAAGGTLAESMEIANAAASVVIHKLGTTGTASPDEIVACWQEAGVWRAG